MTWVLGEHGSWELRQEDVKLYLYPRPSYCDRGHWIGYVEGIMSIDAADGFPRYYMDLDRAKDELYEWLQWRLQREAK